MGSGDWRWWFRTQCRAIAGFESGGGVTRVTLCRKWRWHRGPCELIDGSQPDV